MPTSDRSEGAPKAQDQTATVETVTQHNIDAIMRSEEKRRAEAPNSYRLIQKVSAFCGTISFLVANVISFGVWIVVNQWLWRFDPYPYTFLVFGMSVEAIFLSIFILISQNMATAESERRNHLDLQINLLNERETTALLRLMLHMASSLGVSDADQSEVRQFAEHTNPATVFKQILQAEENQQQRDSDNNVPSVSQS